MLETSESERAALSVFAEHVEAGRTLDDPGPGGYGLGPAAM
jgi:hypothetical protein